MFVLLLSGNKDIVNSSQSSKPVKSSEPIGSKESLKDISPNKGKFETKTERESYQCLFFILFTNLSTYEQYDLQIIS